MPCNRVISSSCHLFYLLIWCFIPTMTSVQEKNRGSLPVVAMPLSETCLPVATQSSQEGLASLWRYLQYITNCTKKLKTVSESLPQGRTGPVFVLKVKLVMPSSSVHWPFPSSSLFPPSFTVLSTELCSISMPSNNAHPQSAGQLNYATWECAQLNTVTIRWEMTKINLFFHICQLFTG